MGFWVYNKYELEDDLYDYSRAREYLTTLVESSDVKYKEAISNLVNSKYFSTLNPSGIEQLIGILDAANSDAEFSETMEYLFFPIEPTKEDKEDYRKIHKGIYKHAAKEFIQEVNNSSIKQPFLLDLESGMFGGKSTFAKELTDALEEIGYEVLRIIPSSMKDGGITVRGESPKKGDKTDSEGHLLLEAFNIDTTVNGWLAQLENLYLEIQSKGKPVVVHFDEYTFMNGFHARMIIEFGLEKGFNFVTSGLRRSYLDEELEGYTICADLITHKKNCKSFVKGINDVTPVGSKTRRYIQLENNQWVLDIGFADVFIPKENKKVLYLPDTSDRHISSKFLPSLKRGIINGFSKLKLGVKAMLEYDYQNTKRNSVVES